MSFAAPYYLWLLAAMPPGLVLFFWWSQRERQRLMAQFVQARLLPNLISGVSARRQKIRAACFVAAVICLIVALARPRWGYDWEEVRQRGLDIIVAVDTSKSMLAEDFHPNRLARAKLAALDLMQQAKSDRLGLVAFAGSAFLECPLTIDDSAFRQSVEALDVNTLPEGGTAIGDAIETAQQAFKEGENYKILVLFTDGEDHDSDALEAARRAAAAGMRIFTIGIGSPEGELLRVSGPDGQSDYIRDPDGNVVKSRLNQDLLVKIAEAAKGFYLPLSGAKTVETLYERGLAPLPKAEAKEKWVKRLHERYHWFLAVGIALLVLETLIPERKTARAARFSADKPALAKAALLVLLLSAMPARSSPSSALREYQSGKYQEAQSEYERLLKKRNDDPRLHFNAGAAAYRNQQFDEAAKHFDQALQSQDLSLQEHAYYNLGNTLYRLGEQNSDPAKKREQWEESLKKYDSSLKLNAQDADAKFNREFVQRRLEELKQQQQQQKKDQSQQNQNQDQKQQSQNQSPQNQKNQPTSHQNQEQKTGSDQNRQQNSSPQKEQSNQTAQKQSQEKQASGEKKNEPKPAQPEPAKSGNRQDAEPENQPAQAYAAGQMTPQQAEQLLDAQKNEEMLLPAKPDKKASSSARIIKDW